MIKIHKRKLAMLYQGKDINLIWSKSLHLAAIDHPELGKISPHQYRLQYHDRPCPFCAKKMVHGSQHSTHCKDEAIARGYQYIDTAGNTTINTAGKGATRRYFHPHYVTLDHKINKARCPERMFDYNNLQIMCWKCNCEKGDNNAYELLHNRSYIQDLAQETLKRYPKL